LEAEGCFQVVQCLHYEIPHGYYYILKLVGSSAEYLHLDCLCDPNGMSRYHVPVSALLEGRTRSSEGVRLSPDKEVLYTLVKRVVKGKIREQDLKPLQQALLSRSKELEEPLSVWFGVEGRAKLETLCRVDDAESAVELLDRLRSDMEHRFRKSHPLSCVTGTILSSVRRLKRLLQPTGLFVVLLGPDGSGKSSVAGLLPVELKRAFRATWRFHWRPNWLPKLSGRDTGEKKEECECVAPPQNAAYDPVISSARFLYYLIDFVVGYWIVIYPRKAQTTLIIGERYFADVLVNPQRYGFALPAWLLRLGATLVPKPDATILLINDPDVVHARKPELSVESIADQMRRYQEELPHWGKVLMVRTDGSAGEVAARISNLLVRECATRLRGA
jgi:thymidylate kinase